MNFKNNFLLFYYKKVHLTLHKKLFYSILAINLVIAYLHTVNIVQGKDSYHLPYVVLHHVWPETSIFFKERCKKEQ